MNHRLLVSVSGLIVLIAVMLLAAMPAAGQATSAAARRTEAPAKPCTAPRTPDGQPDLQGFWTNTTYTPLERPKNVTKEFYTREEALELIKESSRQSKASRPNPEPSPTCTTTSRSSGWTGAREGSR